MSRLILTLANETVRKRAQDLLAALPLTHRVMFQEPARSGDQNAKMWASLTDIATQIKWHGQTLSPDDWKLIFLAGLNQEMRIVPNLAGNGFVNLGRSSSKLSKREMADLITLIQAFGDERGVVFHDTVILENAA